MNVYVGRWHNVGCLCGRAGGAIYDLLRSNVFYTIFNCVWFGLGVLGLFVDRGLGENLLAQGGNENRWAFGQILSLLLIFLPISTAVEIYCGMCFDLSSYESC
jgi:hypothetical protein